MEVFVLLKGYDYEGYGSNVEVFSTREAAEEKKHQYMNGGITAYDDPNVVFDYGYDLVKIVKRKVG
jgi:S-adenosylhomocysteine hydrolase